MQALVTGGAGFIGCHLVYRLLREGFQVRILDNLDPRVHRNGQSYCAPAGVELIRGAVTERHALLAAMNNVDIIFHQAAYQDYMPDFSKFLTVNAVGTSLIYELIVQHRLKIQKVVIASSQAVYGEGQYSCAEHGDFLPVPRTQTQLSRGEWEVKCPRCCQRANASLLREEHTNPYNQYAVSKLAQEKVGLGLGWLYGIPTVALRYSITQGPRQSLFNQYSGVCRIFVSRALKHEPLIIYEDGLQTRDFVHIHDVVEANMCVLENDSANFQAFNVGSGMPTSVLEYANLVRTKLSADIALEVSGEYRRGDNRHSVSNIDKLRSLGWSPKRSLSNILDDFLVWVDSIGGIPLIPDAHGDMQKAGVVLRVAARC